MPHSPLIRQPSKRTSSTERPNRPLEWNEYNRWAHADHTDKEIMAFILADLAKLNNKAGITCLTTSNQDSKKGYSHLN